MNVELGQKIYSVGIVDWNLRDFHGFGAPRGGTYNAYLIDDEKPALIDTVKAPFFETFQANVRARIDPTSIAYVICNHAEPDHSGSLPQMLALAPQATLICTKKCAQALQQHYDTSDWKIQMVANGDEISLGQRTLRFLETPMLHWPDSMFTYVVQDRLLFSMDAFGQHLATSERFDDEVSFDLLMEEARSYYANIIMPYGKRVTELLKTLAELPVDMIAPSHGLVLRAHVLEMLEYYRRWGSFQIQPKVLVMYDSMWGSTAAMGLAIAEGLNSGATVRVMAARNTPIERFPSELLEAAAVAIGSPNLNRGMMPTIAGLLEYFKGLMPVPRLSLAFGSFGWSKGGPDAIEARLQEMGWELAGKALKVCYRPTPESLEACRAAGRELGTRALAAAAAQV